MTTIVQLQSSLKAKGLYAGDLDGRLGPGTYAGLFSVAAGRQLGDLGRQLGAAAVIEFPHVGVMSPRRINNFLAQAAHETADFRYFSELGSDSYLSKYDFRKDLGNNGPGMGAKYRGRGIFMLTGYANYLTVGKALGLDLVTHPELAADPRVAMTIACYFWSTHGLNAMADNDNCELITERINGGQNGLSQREAKLEDLEHFWDGVDALAA